MRYIISSLYCSSVMECTPLRSNQLRFSIRHLCAQHFSRLKYAEFFNAIMPNAAPDHPPNDVMEWRRRTECKQTLRRQTDRIESPRIHLRCKGQGDFSAASWRKNRPIEDGLLQELGSGDESIQLQPARKSCIPYYGSENPVLGWVKLVPTLALGNHGTKESWNQGHLHYIVRDRPPIEELF